MVVQTRCARLAVHFSSDEADPPPPPQGGHRGGNYNHHPHQQHPQEIQHGVDYASLPRQVSFEDDHVATGGGTAQATFGRLPPRELATFWTSTEAKKLFRPRENETAPQAVDHMIQALTVATTEVRQTRGNAGRSRRDFVRNGRDMSGILGVIEGRDRFGIWSSDAKEKIFVHALYVKEALIRAKQVIGSGTRFAFGDCCQYAADKLERSMSIEVRPKPAMIGKWFREFREDRVFPHPQSQRIIDGKMNLFLTFFGDIDKRGDVEGLYDIYITHLHEVGPVTPDYACFYFFHEILRLVSESRGYPESPAMVMRDYPYLYHMPFGVFEDWLRMRQASVERHLIL